jgi:hypothetical protein
MVPAMNSIVDDTEKFRAGDRSAKYQIVVLASQWVCDHQLISISGFAVIALAGFILPFVIRPMRHVVWVAAVAVFLLDVALAGAGYWRMLGTALKEAEGLSR